MKSYKKSIIGFLLIAYPISTITQVLQIASEDQYDSEVLNSGKPVLVQFEAEWCGVCKGIKNSFEEISSEPEFSAITFARVNIDQHKALSQKNGIVGVPSFMYLENGNKKDQEIGIQNMKTFKETLRNNLRKVFAIAQNDQKEPMEIVPEEPQEPLIKVEDVEEHVIAEQPAPEQDMKEPTAKEEPAGLMERLWAMLAYVLCAIKEIWMMIINWIKELFGY